MFVDKFGVTLSLIFSVKTKNGSSLIFNFQFSIFNFQFSIFNFQFPCSGRSSGKRITSRILVVLVKIMTSRSIPIPSPPAGGIP